MPVNEAQPLSAHLPCLLDDGRHRLPNKVARPIAVQVDLYEERIGSFCRHRRPLLVNDGEPRGEASDWPGEPRFEPRLTESESAMPYCFC